MLILAYTDGNSRNVIKVNWDLGFLLLTSRNNKLNLIYYFCMYIRVCAAILSGEDYGEFSKIRSLIYVIVSKKTT